MKNWINLALAAVLLCLPALAQSNPNNSAEDSYAGSIQAVPLTPVVRQISLADAIDLGIQHNLALNLARYKQQSAAAQKLQLENYLLPNITAHGEVGFHQINLESTGFRPSLITQFGYPSSQASSFPLVTKVTSHVGEIKLTQALFTWSGWDAWRAGKALERASYYSKESALGLVILNVASTYLRILADSSRIDYADSLLNTDQQLLYQAHQEHLAGVVANIDELRARVQVQQQQQVLITTQNNLSKDKIALNRQIGLAPGQQIQLTDAAPYSDLAPMTIGQARAQAYQNRQVYQKLKQQIVAATLESRAIKHERYPSLSFSGNYGVTGVSGLVNHGTFVAMGTLNIPIFHEAKFRGDADVASAQLDELRSQMNDLTTQIDQQLRDSLLDLHTARQLVDVSKSNVTLASTALDQATQRYKSGVDDNLPVAQAQSTLAQAQQQYVDSVYRYNLTKLGFARNLGIIETQYKNYLPQVSTPPPAH
jgi:outer membrane protein TolC